MLAKGPHPALQLFACEVKPTARRLYLAGMFRSTLALALLLTALPQVALANPRTEDELAALNARIAASPTDVDLLLQRAELRLREAEPEAALADLRLVEAIRPADPRLSLLRGWLDFERGADERAVVELETYVARTGGTVFAHALLGRLHERNDRLAEAVASYDDALVHGDDVDVYLRRGRLLAVMGRLDRAAAGYEAGLAATGAVALRVALVELETRRGRYDRALALVEDGERRAGNDGRWLLRRADVLEAAGRSAEAQRVRRSALAEAERRLARRPSPAALMERGRALLALGRHREAIADLSQARRRAPRLREAASLLARALGERGGDR